MRIENRHVPRTIVALATIALVAAAGCSSSGGDSTTGPESTTGTNRGQSCGVHDVSGTEVRTFCGTGTATVKSTKVSMSLPKASCETATNYVAVNAGTVVLGADEATKKVKASTQYI